MGTTSLDERDRMIDEYCDGLMSDSDRASMESRMAADAGLQQAVRLQRDIDASMRRAFVPPDPDAILARAVAAVPERPELVAHPWRRRMAIGFGIAAMIAGAVVSGATVMELIRGERTPGYAATGPWRSLATVYEDTVQAGFEPQWVCKDEREFARTFWKKLGKGILLAKLRPGVQAVGISYCHSLSRTTVMILAKVDGKEVLVFVDWRSRDRTPQPAIDGLYLHRAELANLVVYELSPLAEPQLLDKVKVIEMPEEWKTE